MLTDVNYGDGRMAIDIYVEKIGFVLACRLTRANVKGAP
jgi:hypothetical protein